MVAEAERLFGKPDVVVNNAGWTHRNRPMLEVSEDEFDKVSRHQRQEHLPPAPSMPCLRCAVRVGAASSTLPPLPGCGPAPASPGTTAPRVRSSPPASRWRRSWGPTIRVNCLNLVFNPDTGLAAEFAGGPVDDARRAKFLATIPLGRFSHRAGCGQRRAFYPRQRRSRLHQRRVH